MAGLAGLPPGLTGQFAKINVIDSLLDGDIFWLAIIIALNAVIGIVCYIRPGRRPLPRGRHREPEAPARTPWPVTFTLTAATVLGIASQLVLHLAGG